MERGVAACIPCKQKDHAIHTENSPHITSTIDRRRQRNRHLQLLRGRLTTSRTCLSVSTGKPRPTYNRAVGVFSHTREPQRPVAWPHFLQGTTTYCSIHSQPHKQSYTAVPLSVQYCNKRSYVAVCLTIITIITVADDNGHDVLLPFPRTKLRRETGITNRSRQCRQYHKAGAYYNK